MVRLRQYWLPATRGFGIGITTVDRAAARIIATRAMDRLPAGAALTGDILDDVDIRSLDPVYVQPFVVAPEELGIWFPARNRAPSVRRPSNEP